MTIHSPCTVFHNRIDSYYMREDEGSGGSFDE